MNINEIFTLQGNLYHQFEETRLALEAEEAVEAWYENITEEEYFKNVREADRKYLEAVDKAHALKEKLDLLEEAVNAAGTLWNCLNKLEG